MRTIPFATHFDRNTKPAVEELMDLLTGPASKKRMAIARTLCESAIKERTALQRRIKHLKRNSFSGRINRFKSIFRRTVL